ncbi:Putative carbohydrate metabolism domain-containing protein [Pedobacter sp. ok626]|uniref:PCMD domain-containing protein n=1 Tax=Pedobacter sp. ok626 TaxID=1761882 RepID=UPI000891BA32|nr:PCMD domain-containing protein [Pedobacter sp. ok626]SDK56841.1 Putative carbohydrate metabolism domain-containing protein [Pedobacter sp. ok626]
MLKKQISNFRIRRLVTCSLMIFCLQGCIKEALPNIEADVIAVDYVADDFFAEPQISNREIKLFLNKEKNNINSFKFQFKLSRGATSIPQSGTPQDFSNPVEYVVTSENGEFKKTYKVTATDEKLAFTPLSFDFENYSIENQNKYTIFYDLSNGKASDTWSSGNAGFVLSISPLKKKEPSLYPLQFTEQAHSGKYAAKLETKSTGVFGSSAKKPIAAGNIFLGKFDSGNVMGDPLKSTMFGIPIAKAPASFEGFYHYTPGEQVIDEESKPSSEIESCSLVAVLFDAEALFLSSGSYFLNGTNILTDKSIVAKAELYDSEPTQGDRYKPFSIPFQYLSQPIGKDFNTGRYKIAIVLSSSKNGDRFTGAIGSILLIDDLKINIL